MRQTWRPSYIVAHTSPSTPATTAGLRPVGIVSTTRFVAGSIRLTVLPPSFGTQTCPATASRFTGLVPTLIVATTRRLFESMRVTVLLPLLATQIAPSVAATQAERSPRVGTRVHRYERGSSR